MSFLATKHQVEKEEGNFLYKHVTKTLQHATTCKSVHQFLAYLEPQTQISRISVCRCARKCSPKSNCPGGWKLARVPSRLWSGHGHLLLSRLGRSNGWFWFHPSRSTKRNINDFFGCSISAKCQHLDGVKQSYKGYCKWCSFVFSVAVQKTWPIIQISKPPVVHISPHGCPRRSSKYHAIIVQSQRETSLPWDLVFYLPFGVEIHRPFLHSQPILGLPLHTDLRMRYKFSSWHATSWCHKDNLFDSFFAVQGRKFNGSQHL